MPLGLTAGTSTTFWPVQFTHGLSTWKNRTIRLRQKQPEMDRSQLKYKDRRDLRAGHPVSVERYCLIIRRNQPLS
ncbi:hypothetical protein RLO149_c009570 [Roseobacter litoralis Och 149]|uniref:Uncharacterized protein n=1 Tax=Roseobacter litoralis (strain ATCC 49566 / DSM 6996 / JCM 21268 / NBRC 15278 / OCh 149) TaxID=391595 RepID=F7ZAH1_ROSLO|nr:hypothetical protein RLO149_c009570 [Roseobacter litoralis Och 149]